MTSPLAHLDDEQIAELSLYAAGRGLEAIREGDMGKAKAWEDFLAAMKRWYADSERISAIPAKDDTSRHDTPPTR